MEQNWTRMYIAREALLSINNAITDGLLLYRCAAIWGSSPYARVVIAISSLLIIATLVAGLYSMFGIDVASTPIPYSLALVTNFLLLGLTGYSVAIESPSVIVLTEGIYSQQNMEEGATGDRSARR